MPYFDFLNAEGDPALAARLDELLALAAKSAGRQARKARAAAHVRLGLALAASAAVVALGASVPVAVLFGVFSAAWAILATVNAWATSAHVLGCFASDQALELHRTSMDAVADASRRLRDEMKRLARQPA